MGWHTIRRMTPEDEARAIPRLVKFCKRHKIVDPDENAIYRHASDGQKLRYLHYDIDAWVAEGDFDGTRGQRAQRARRVWQRAVKEPRADFVIVMGEIGYHR